MAQGHRMAGYLVGDTPSRRSRGQAREARYRSALPGSGARRGKQDRRDLISPTAGADGRLTNREAMLRRLKAAKSLCFSSSRLKRFVWSLFFSRIPLFPRARGSAISARREDAAYEPSDHLLLDLIHGALTWPF